MHPTVSRNDPRIAPLLGRVRRMARAIARSLPSCVQLDDLIAAGNLGVATARTRYTGDPSGFEHFAIVHARGAMIDELRRLDTMSRTGRADARRAQAIAQKLSRELGRTAEDDEVAAAMGVEVDAYRQLVVQRRVTRVDAIDHDRIDSEAVPADEAIDARRERRRLSAQLASLPDRHATVIELSFIKGETLQAIATTLGVSIARAHQIREAALVKLREACVRDVHARAAA